MADPVPPTDPAAPPPNGAAPVNPLDIIDELRDSYLTYAQSVIVSRALPDVRDGLKPSQRRILVAMHDLNLGPTSATSKCAGIVGETMKRYHPHGDMSIYPTLVRMAQDWNMRSRLIQGQGNFGSIAGLPAAAMRYTEARLSAVSASMSASISAATAERRASVYRMAAGGRPAMEPKFPWPWMRRWRMAQSWAMWTSVM